MSLINSKISVGCGVLRRGRFCFVIMFFLEFYFWGCRSACSLAKNRDIYKTFVEKSEVWRQVAKSKNIRKGKIKMNVK